MSDQELILSGKLIFNDEFKIQLQLTQWQSAYFQKKLAENTGKMTALLCDGNIMELSIEPKITV
jgi:hypothetical protein